MPNILKLRDRLASHLSNLLDAMPKNRQAGEMSNLKLRFQEAGLLPEENEIREDDPLSFSLDLMSEELYQRISLQPALASAALEAKTPEQMADALT